MKTQGLPRDTFDQHQIRALLSVQVADMKKGEREKMDQFIFPHLIPETIEVDQKITKEK
jgi:hypothetical protein